MQDIVIASGRRKLPKQEALYRMWQVMRDLRIFTQSDVYKNVTGSDLTIQLNMSTVQVYLRRLEVGGFVEATDGRIAKTYELVKDPVQYPDLDDNGKPCRNFKSENSMWKVIRKKPEFTLRELAFIADVSLEVARVYLQTLQDAELVERVSSNGPKTHRTLYRISREAKNMAKAPVLVQEFKLWDANGNKYLSVKQREKGLTA